jgi:hypothetical protein
LLAVTIELFGHALFDNEDDPGASHASSSSYTHMCVCMCTCVVCISCMYLCHVYYV